jgi:hypothetical protein
MGKVCRGFGLGFGLGDAHAVMAHVPQAFRRQQARFAAPAVVASSGDFGLV